MSVQLLVLHHTYLVCVEHQEGPPRHRLHDEAEVSLARRLVGRHPPAALWQVELPAQRGPVEVVQLVVADDVHRGAGQARQLAKRGVEGERAVAELGVDAVDDVAEVGNEQWRVGQGEPPVHRALQRAEGAAVPSNGRLCKVVSVLMVGPLHVCDDAKREQWPALWHAGVCGDECGARQGAHTDHRATEKGEAGAEWRVHQWLIKPSLP
mmetsp:Transcript_32769/g.79587  ORF Transcript_32769/g.79587 Transcript_32769/m.79587 type:complete len:209 (-) Transcript_32769:219-845(-)